MGLKSYQDVREDTAITVDTAGASDISEKLLAWHHGRVRQFPWRDTRDPFAILLAEVMLQRTQAPQAARIFAEFISKYSSPIAVIHTEPEVVETLLSGLGLRHRARRVIELCKALIDRHGGMVPDDPWHWLPYLELVRIQWLPCAVLRSAMMFLLSIEMSYVCSLGWWAILHSLLVHTRIADSGMRQLRLSQMAVRETTTLPCLT